MRSTASIVRRSSAGSALLIFSPILVSVVVRSYGWIVLLSDQGPVNWLLLRLGIVAEPVTLVFNLFGVVISLTHVFLPFVVFPIFSSLTRLDPELKEAAEDLGAGWWTTFRRITFPLSLPGVVAGAQICFHARARRLRDAGDARRRARAGAAAASLQRDLRDQLAGGRGRRHGAAGHRR